MLTIKFEDGELVQGRGWMDLPNKAIKRVKLQVDDKIFVMEDYESYNHLVEKAFMPLNQGKTLIKRVLLMGRKEHYVKVIGYNFLTNEKEEYVSAFGFEYNGRVSTGWKQGIKTEIPKYKVI